MLRVEYLYLTRANVHDIDFHSVGGGHGQATHDRPTAAANYRVTQHLESYILLT